MVALELLLLAKFRILGQREQLPKSPGPLSVCIWIAVLFGFFVNLILVALSLPEICHYFCSAVVSGLPCLYYFLFF